MTDEIEPIEDRAAGLERRLAELQASSTAQLVRAELKAHAIRAGMLDLDGLKLLDLDAVVLDDQGEVAGGDALMRRLRADKPWLFAPASSSTAAAPPPAQPPAARLATEMSFAEWQAARTAILKRR